MRSHTVDYDSTNIPAVYDRGRDHGPEVRDLWYVPFFPSTRSMLEDLLPDRPEVFAVFETAGFRCVESQIVTQIVAPSGAAYADKLSAGGDSVLARLAQDELARGLEAIRRYGDGPGGRPVAEPIDVLFVFDSRNQRHAFEPATLRLTGEQQWACRPLPVTATICRIAGLSR